MKKSLLTTGVAIATLALTTLTFAGVRNNLPEKADFSAVQTAVAANNYASLSDTIKAKITQAQFDKMVAREAAHKAVEAAITAGDYTAFRNAKIAEIPTEADFKIMVADQKIHATEKAAVEAAIKSGDFAAYKKARTDAKTALDALHPDRPVSDRPAPTDAQLQKQFDRMVAAYKANGTLPSADQKGPGMGGERGGEGPEGHKGGPRGGDRGQR